MKVDIHIAKGSKLVHIGYIETPVFDADRCWELCNWKHWLKTKPQNLHADIYSCSHGVCFTNPETNEMWLAKSIGWLVGNETKINKYIKENENEVIWI